MGLIRPTWVKATNLCSRVEKNFQPQEKKLSKHFSSQQRGNFLPERVSLLGGCERIMTNYEENE